MWIVSFICLRIKRHTVDNLTFVRDNIITQGWGGCSSGLCEKRQNIAFWKYSPLRNACGFWCFVFIHGIRAHLLIGASLFKYVWLLQISMVRENIQWNRWPNAQKPFSSKVVLEEFKEIIRTQAGSPLKRNIELCIFTNSAFHIILKHLCFPPQISFSMRLEFQY